MNSILQQLMGSKQSFEEALATVSGEGTNLLFSLLEVLDTDNTIDNSEKDRRLTAIYSRLNLIGGDQRALAIKSAALKNSIVRNTVAQLISPEYRPLVFRPEGSPIQANIPAARAESPSKIARVVWKNAESEFADVVILSMEETPATRKLLANDGFVPLRCSSVAELETMLARNVGVCSFLVENSFLAALSETEQRSILRRIAEYSTFTFIRLEEEKLLLSNHAVSELISSSRCRMNTNVNELAFRDRPNLQERELEYLRVARSRLHPGKLPSLFVPGELSDAELSLLSAAMSEFAQVRKFNPRVELSSVTTRFLQGGETGAKVAVVRANDLHVPVIVKIAEKSMILDEARRFLTYIFKDDPDLRPEVHMHGSAALIIFGLIPKPDLRVDSPAPTLDEELKNLWFLEMMDPKTNIADQAPLAGFRNAVKKLVRINSQECSDRSFPAKANPYISSIQKMETSGFDWGFGTTNLSLRSQAENILKAHVDAAVCHGDAHTRNVLIRGNDGFLIDYAYSGPGHPCADLAKLELSLFLGRFVQFGSEDQIVAIQRDLTEGLEIEELLKKHSAGVCSKSNAVCLRLCSIARNGALDVLSKHKLGIEHYKAAKLLSAWQALQIPSLQPSLVRCVILCLNTL
jgi:hypothetical protein